MISFLQNIEIDRLKWDKCISSSRQGLIYGMSWYLDLVSPGWCGLKEDDYSAVMPLPVKKKYGFPYIIQPLYAQQLGVFSENKLAPEKITEFLKCIPLQYKYIHLNLNFENDVVPGFAFVRISNNFVLGMGYDYKTISGGYSENTRRNIQKASGLSVHFDGSAEELVNLKTENTAINRKRIPSQKIMNYVSTLIERGSGFICRASLNNKTIAAVMVLHHQARIYYLIPVSNPAGKEKKAMFAVIDAIIQKYAGSDMVLDFEGSNIPGLARFFGGFGAVNQAYPVIKINRMPFPLNQFRKS
jgi:hypothetical protein